MDGQDGSPEQQGLLKEVVLVGVSLDASKMLDAFGGFMGASWLPGIRRGGQGAEKQAGRSLLCELLCPPVLRTRSVRLQ